MYEKNSNSVVNNNNEKMYKKKLQDFKKLNILKKIISCSLVVIGILFVIGGIGTIWFVNSEMKMSTNNFYEMTHDEAESELENVKGTNDPDARYYAQGLKYLVRVSDILETFGFFVLLSGIVFSILGFVSLLNIINPCISFVIYIIINVLLILYFEHFKWFAQLPTDKVPL